MKGAGEIRKTMLSSETEEVTRILESLDENSIVLARTYMTALLIDRKSKRQGRRSWQRQQYKKKAKNREPQRGSRRENLRGGSDSRPVQSVDSQTAENKALSNGQRVHLL